MAAILEIQRQSRGNFGNVDQDLQRIATAANSTIGQLGALVTVSGTVTVALTAVATSSLNAFRELDTARGNLATLVEGSDDYVRALGELSRELDNNVSRTELTTAAYDVASAGFASQAEVVDVLRASYIAASGNQGDLGDTTIAVTKLLNAYNLEASEAANVSDQLALAVENGQLTLGELSPELSKVVGSASNASIAIEELLQTIATLTTRGLSTTQSTTGLNRLIGEIIDPSAESELTAFFARLNTTGEQLLAENGLAGTLRIIREEFGTTSTAIASLFGSTSSQRVATPLLQNLELLQSNIEEASDAAGVAADNYERANDTIGSSTEALGNAFNDLQASLGEGIADLIRPLVVVLTDTVNAFNALEPETKRFIGRVIAIGAAVAGIIAVIAGAQLAFAAIGGSIAAAAVALAPFTAALIVAGTAATVTAIAIDVFNQRLREEIAVGQQAAERATQRADAINALRQGMVLEDEERRKLIEGLREQVEAGNLTEENYSRLVAQLGDLQRENIAAAAAAEEQAQAIEQLAESSEAAIDELESLKSSLQFESQSIDLDVGSLNSELESARATNDLIISQLELQLEAAGSEAEQQRISNQILDQRLAQKNEELRIERKIEEARLRQQSIAAQISRTEAEILRLQARQEARQATQTGDTEAAALAGEQERLATQSIELQDRSIAQIEGQIAGLDQIFTDRAATAANDIERERLRERNALLEAQTANQRQQTAQQETANLQNQNQPSQTVPTSTQTTQVVEVREVRTTEQAEAGRLDLERQLATAGEAFGEGAEQALLRAQAEREQRRQERSAQNDRVDALERGEQPVQIAEQIEAAVSPIPLALEGIPDALVSAVSQASQQSTQPQAVVYPELLNQIGLLQTAIQAALQTQTTAQGATTTAVQTGSQQVSLAIGNIRFPASLPANSSLQ